MKVLYILKSFAIKAGTERVMSDKMNWLAEHGYEVTMVTYEQGKHLLAFSLHPSINHVNINTPFFHLKKYRHFFRFMSMRRHYRRQLQSLIDRIQPDILITTTYSLNLIDIFLSLKTSAYRILESHVACYTVKKSYDYRHNPILSRIAVLYDFFIMKKVSRIDCLVTLTQGDANDWMKYSSNVVVIPNPVSFYPEAIKSHDGKGHRILSVGRLHEQKGYDLLINAFGLIADQCPDWNIYIYGDGPEKEKLLLLINQKKLTERIIIKDPVSTIYEEYQQSEFYVLSSRYEGFPLVLNETMSCGIPCIAFRCKYGPEDIIVDGGNGLLVEKENIKELAQMILWMIEHTDERLRMGKAARETALRYKKSEIMRLWTDMFEKIGKAKTLRVL